MYDNTKTDPRVHEQYLQHHLVDIHQQEGVDLEILGKTLEILSQRVKSQQSEEEKSDEDKAKILDNTNIKILINLSYMYYYNEDSEDIKNIYQTYCQTINKNVKVLKAILDEVDFHTTILDEVDFDTKNIKFVQLSQHLLYDACDNNEKAEIYLNSIENKHDITSKREAITAYLYSKDFIDIDKTQDDQSFSNQILHAYLETQDTQQDTQSQHNVESEQHKEGFKNKVKALLNSLGVEIVNDDNIDTLFNAINSQRFFISNQNNKEQLFAYGRYDSVIDRINNSPWGKKIIEAINEFIQIIKDKAPENIANKFCKIEVGQHKKIFQDFVKKHDSQKPESKTTIGFNLK